MKGRTCVVTGASGGIGRAIAVGLARLGADLALVCRNEDKGRAVVEEARAAGAPRVDLHLADLSRMDAVRKIAAEITARTPHIHVLINNAGGMHTTRKLTVDGHEMTFAVNHLAYFLLTHELLGALKASAPSRVINVASQSHRRAREIPFDDLRAERGYDAFNRYGVSKLANLLFTFELSRRLAGTGVTANCFHPGVVATGFGQNDPGLLRLGVRIAHLFMISPEKGAETGLYLAASPEVANLTGRYFIKCAEARSSPASLDERAARRLWEVSERLVGIE